MRSEWPVVFLGDHCTKIGSGATPKGGKEAYLDAGPYRLIRSQNVYNDGFAWQGLAFISEEQARRLDGVSVQGGDVLVNITGNSVARVCTAPATALPARVNQHVAIVRPRNTSFDADFLRWYLCIPEQQEKLLGLASAGATRNALTKSMLEGLAVPKPSMEMQRELVAPLVAIERRIDLLRQTNATLESIAQALFESWFVNFDPVRAKAEGREPEGMHAATAELFPAELDESALGSIPNGWGVVRLGNMIELVYGKALKVTDRRPGCVPVYGSGGLTGYHNEALVGHASIVVGRKGTVGALYWEDAPFFPIDTTFYVKPKTAPLTFCFYAMQRLGLEHMNTDAAVPGLNRENAYRLNVLQPVRKVLEAFHGLVTPLREAMRANSLRADTLVQIRDSLLPRLISGKLRFREAQDKLEEATR